MESSPDIQAQLRLNFPLLLTSVTDGLWAAKSSPMVVVYIIMFLAAAAAGLVMNWLPVGCRERNSVICF